MSEKPSYEELEAKVRNLENQVRDMENELHQAQWDGEFFSRSMLESLPFDFWVQDLQDQVILQSHLSRRHWGEALRGSDISYGLPVSDLGLLKKNKSKVLQGQTVAWEMEARTGENPSRVYYNLLSPIYSRGVINGILGIFFDVTDQRVAQEALNDSRLRLRVLLEQLPGAMMWTTDMELRNTLSLGSALETIGQESTQTPGMSLEDFFGTTDPDFAPFKAHKAALNGISSAYEIVWDHRTFQAHTEPLRKQNGVIAGVISVAIDVTERKAIEIALRESNEMARALLNASADIVFLLDQEGALLALNQTCASSLRLSVDDALGACLWDMPSQYLPTIEREQIQSVLDSGRSTRFAGEADSRFYDILVYPIHDQEDRVNRVAVFARDVTAQKQADEEKIRLESQLQQAQKAEAIGTLAGGIAHDFNNILSAIMGYTEMCTMEIPEGSMAHRNLLQVLKASHRAKDLVGQILTFSRQKGQEQRPVKLDLVVKEALKLLRASLPSSVTFRRYIRKDAGKVLADPTSMHQVLMNLCTNASHAMGDTGGVLEVRLENEVFEPGDTLPDPEMLPGKYLCLMVADTGRGMDNQTRERIFDPYFTTKEMGEGTGLGLAVVHGIVKSHAGAITVESGVGKGTVFKVYLPETEAGEVADEEHAFPAPRGKEHILFIDDEPDLLQLGRQMLEHLGYQVTTFDNPPEALKAFKQSSHVFDCVIMDQTMPVMTGGVLAQRILEVRPDIPIVLCTGYSEIMTEEKAWALGIKGYMMKPLELFRLSTTVREVLDSSE
ncbi:MAG: response regulator [Desulfatibacillum sp.]|nr:response regulator [Desulfatibacillum sp.]